MVQKNAHFGFCEVKTSKYVIHPWIEEVFLYTTMCQAFTAIFGGRYLIFQVKFQQEAAIVAVYDGFQAFGVYSKL